jgi:hypothetical protein
MIPSVPGLARAADAGYLGAPEVGVNSMEARMIATSRDLCRLGYLLAVGVVATVALWPWVQGPANLALSQFTGWLVSGLIADRVAKRALAWKTALAQGLVSGVTVWLTLRWLQG